jgi:PAS domain S-box-containing protein
MNSATPGEATTPGQPSRLSPGHHIGEGRNIVPSGQGLAGNDIFHAAVQMSRMPMCLTDPNLPDNPIVFCNQAYEQLTGYPQAELIGHNCRMLQGPATDRATIKRIRDKLSMQEDVHEEVFNYRKDGGGYWNALYISPVVDEAGRLQYFFGSQIDVTSRREAEAVLQQSQRMETLGSMAASLAHEFNNLMTIVLAGIEQSRSVQDPERRNRVLDRAEWGGRRAARLTDQMLSFARRQFHDTQVGDLNSLVGKVDDILDQMAGSSCTVEVELTPAPMPVAVDAAQLEMALINLVRNASDAMPSGGVITIRTEAYGEELVVAVEDRGEGMPPDVARRAADPFFTTKPVGKGTGLGLSMVKGFAEQSGGRLLVESQPGRGTTVRIVLPRFQEHAAATG